MFGRGARSAERLVFDFGLTVFVELKLAGYLFL